MQFHHPELEALGFPNGLAEISLRLYRCRAPRCRRCPHESAVWAAEPVETAGLPTVECLLGVVEPETRLSEIPRDTLVTWIRLRMAEQHFHLVESVGDDLEYLVRNLRHHAESVRENFNRAAGQFALEPPRQPLRGLPRLTALLHAAEEELHLVAETGVSLDDPELNPLLAVLSRLSDSCGTLLGQSVLRNAAQRLP